MRAVASIPAILGLWRHNLFLAPFSATRQATRNLHTGATVLD